MHIQKMFNRIRRREPNKLATTTMFNEVVDALVGQSGSHTGIELLAQRAGVDFLGRIVDTPSGRTVFTDHRYWVMPQFVKAVANAEAVVQLKQDLLLFEGAVPVTNLSEADPADLSIGTHGLIVGTPVRCTLLYDASGDSPNIVYVMNEGGGSVPVGQYQEMVLKMVTQNQVGYDFVAAHALI